MDEENEVVIVTNVYGDVCLRKARRKRQKLLVRELMYDYAKNTTLHGLPYVTRTGLTLVEKFFWLVTFIASVYMCLYLISKVWDKWQNSPVIVTVSEQLVPVREDDPQYTGGASPYILQSDNGMGSAELNYAHSLKCNRKKTDRPAIRRRCSRLWSSDWMMKTCHHPTVPFPSVTICPQSKCKVSVYNFTDEKVKMETFMMQNNVTINETMRLKLAKFAGISGICDIYPEFSLLEVYPKNHTDASVVKHIMEVAPNYKDVFIYCLVHAEFRRCTDLFDKVLTSEGLCYNMNSLAARKIFRTRKLQRDYEYLYTTKPVKNWSVEKGYTETFTSNDAESKEDPDVYPARGAENGKYPDIQVILQHNQDERDNLCNGINSGFKVYVHHPTDLPQSSLYYYAVLNNQVSSMALSFSILNTLESLRGYDPEKRQCYFPDERYLKYFSIYTASNCNIECLSNITYERCGCVAFYMPNSSSNKICTQINNFCVKAARRIMRHREVIKDSKRCHCLPACNSMDYDAEILKTEFNLKQLMETYQKASSSFDDSFKGVNFSKLEIYFKRPRFLSMRRSELYGVIEFLSSCGGLLGLFLGFSFLSLVEIFYFLSLRLCCTLKKDLEEEKTQNEPENKNHLDLDRF